MTMSATPRTVNAVGNGATTSFSFGTARIFAATDLVVTVDGTAKTLGTDYTVVSGNVIFTTAPADGTAVKIRSAIPLNRDTDFGAVGRVSPEQLDEDLDRVTGMLQEREEVVTEFTENVESRVAFVESKTVALETRVGNLEDLTPGTAIDLSTLGIPIIIANSNPGGLPDGTILFLKRGLYTIAPSVPGIAQQACIFSAGMTFDLTISDPYDTGGCTITFDSTDSVILPVTHVTDGGSGGDRTVTIAPLDGAGRSTLNIHVTSQISGLTTTISVLCVFGSRLFSVDVTAGANGTATADNAACVEGGTYTFTGMPDSGYYVSQVGVDVGTDNEQILTGVDFATFNGIDADHTVAFAFALNNAPTISAIDDVATPFETATAAIPFTIGDAETAVGSLIVTRTTSNATLLPLANCVLGGSGASRDITCTPATGESGTVTVTITVDDGALTTDEAFILTVGDGVTDTFTRADSSTIGGEWREINGDFAISSNRLAIVTPTNDCMAINDAVADTDCEVTGKFLIDNPAANSIIGMVIGRCTAETAGAFTNYHARCLSAGGGTIQQVRLYKTVAGTHTQLGSSVDKTMANGETWCVKLRIVGSALKAKMWKDGTSEPGAWDIELTDTSITASGKTGLGTLGGSTWLMRSSYFRSVAL